MTYRGLVFAETPIIATQVHYKNHAHHALAAFDPLFPFALLAANIDHVQVVFALAAGEAS